MKPQFGHNTDTSRTHHGHITDTSRTQHGHNTDTTRAHHTPRVRHSKRNVGQWDIPRSLALDVVKKKEKKRGGQNDVEGIAPESWYCTLPRWSTEASTAVMSADCAAANPTTVSACWTSAQPRTSSSGGAGCRCDDDRYPNWRCEFPSPSTWMGGPPVDRAWHRIASTSQHTIRAVGGAVGRSIFIFYFVQ